METVFLVITQKKNLMIKYPLFGSILANTTFVETTKVETAATNGKQIFYNTEFLNTLTELFSIFNKKIKLIFDYNS